MRPPRARWLGGRLARRRRRPVLRPMAVESWCSAAHSRTSRSALGLQRLVLVQGVAALDERERRPGRLVGRARGGVRSVAEFAVE